MKCNKCAKDMVIRHRKSDGQKFWGCSGFPKCRNVVSYKNEGKRELKSIPNPSPYQKKIFEAVESLAKIGNYEGKNHLIIMATAGSGKTTTEEHCVGLIKSLCPKDEIIYLVFNKRVELEATEKGLPAKTTHSKFFADLCNHLDKRPKVVADKVKKIIEDLIPESRWDDDKWMVPLTCKIISTVKNTLAPTEAQTLLKICDRFGIELNGSQDEIFELVRIGLEKNNQDLSTVDFDDMLYLTYKLSVGCKQFDWVLIDECFPYFTPIQMKDGNGLAIGDIVENKMKGEVLTFNVKTGKQEYKRITGWHRKPNKEELVKVLAIEIPSCMGGHRAFVTCTKNHKFWTKEDGWVKAKDLKPGFHHIQKEASAVTSQKYKITSEGKKKLSKTITKHNEIGLTGNKMGIYGGQGIKEENRGGNGKGLTIPQKLLLDALGEEWVPEFVIKPTKSQRLTYKTPTNYKVDLGNPRLKIAIELDASLKKAKAIYEKKDAVLKELGWEIYRFENYYAVRNLDEIVRKFEQDCPIWCEVVSVVPNSVKEYFIYDLSVEDNHNFYANGILVHNCQDFNRAQLELMKRSIKPDGHAIMVGDKNQSIYGFRGAALDAMENLKSGLDAYELPLSISYRCSKESVEMINTLFPEIPIQTWEKAKQGWIDEISSLKMIGQVKEGDLVLCRNNAPLVAPAFSLIRQGVKAVILGRDIGKGLIVLIEKFQKESLDETLAKLENYKNKEVRKLLSLERNSQAQALEDKVETIFAVSDDCSQVWEVKKRIEEIFSDDKEGVVFSTVHKAKGGEADNVYILKPQLMPSKYAKKDWELEQEQNIMFVAFSRSKDKLIFVDGPTP